MTQGPTLVLGRFIGSWSLQPRKRSANTSATKTIKPSTSYRIRARIRLGPTGLLSPRRSTPTAHILDANREAEMHFRNLTFAGAVAILSLAPAQVIAQS